MNGESVVGSKLFQIIFHSILLFTLPRGLLFLIIAERRLNNDLKIFMYFLRLRNPVTPLVSVFLTNWNECEKILHFNFPFVSSGHGTSVYRFN